MARELDAVLDHGEATHATSCISENGSVSFLDQIICPIYDTLAAVSPFVCILSQHVSFTSCLTSDIICTVSTYLMDTIVWFITSPCYISFCTKCFYSFLILDFYTLRHHEMLFSYLFHE